MMNQPRSRENLVDRPWASPAVRHVLDTMSDAFLALDESGTALFANSAALEVHGREYADLVGRRYWREFPEAIGTGLQDLVLKTFATGEKQIGEIECADGSSIFEATALPAIEAVHVYLRDVTSRVRTQREALRVAEQQRIMIALADAVQGLSDPQQIVHKTLHVVGSSLNVARCSYSLVSVDEDKVVIQDEYVDGVPTIIGEFRLSDFGPEILEALSAGVPIAIEDVFEHPATSRNREIFEALQVRSGLTVPLVRQGKLVATFGVNHTVPRKWSEDEVDCIAQIASRLWNTIEWARDMEKLRRSEARFRAAVNAVGVLWTNDAEGKMTGDQPGWTSLTGQTREQYERYGWADAVHPDDAVPTIDAWQVAVRDRSTFVFEHRVRVADGNYRRFSIRAVPVLDEKGEVREWVGVHTPAA